MLFEHRILDEGLLRDWLNTAYKSACKRDSKNEWSEQSMIGGQVLPCLPYQNGHVAAAKTVTESISRQLYLVPRILLCDQPFPLPSHYTHNVLQHFPKRLFWSIYISSVLAAGASKEQANGSSCLLFLPSSIHLSTGKCHNGCSAP